VVAANAGRDFVRILANDCLASSPPLTFFRDVIVDEAGEESPVFRLEHSALLPLVDVGRVFGLAAKRALGTSTLERFALASSALPEYRLVFREAAETLRIVLWLQARVGIAQGTTGAELPPALVSRHDRHLLKSGFRSIHQLLELTAGSAWLEDL
jgi:CBS domain-containing protein